VGSIAIRRAGAADAATLAELGAETFVETFGHHYRRADIDAFLRERHALALYHRLLANPAYALWLAEDGETSVGYAVAGPSTLPVPDLREDEREGAGELARLYVRRSHQGRRLGSRLLALALPWLRERHRPIFLSVYAGNVGAQRLYARHGFVKRCDYTYMVGEHPDPEWIMEWAG